MVGIVLPVRRQPAALHLVRASVKEEVLACPPRTHSLPRPPASGDRQLRDPRRLLVAGRELPGRVVVLAVPVLGGRDGAEPFAELALVVGLDGADGCVGCRRLPPSGGHSSRVRADRALQHCVISVRDAESRYRHKLLGHLDSSPALWLTCSLLAAMFPAA